MVGDDAQTFVANMKGGDLGARACCRVAVAAWQTDCPGRYAGLRGGSGRCSASQWHKHKCGDLVAIGVRCGFVFPVACRQADSDSKVLTVNQHDVRAVMAVGNAKQGVGQGKGAADGKSVTGTGDDLALTIGKNSQTAGVEVARAVAR
ncbi:hypothetical protein SDC9_137823 [bioreactor metagenome]|uniref:Uncharacterized protein n=1 Tax=bioreactor metagenome TaxID=1076179 RepID=A0A645DN58_9ZZZZ